MKYTFCLFVSCLVGLLLSCSHPRETTEPSFALNEKSKINNIIPEYLTKIPEIDLTFKNYANYKFGEYTINGSVDSANLKQGYWKIINVKSNLLYQGSYVDSKKNGWWDILCNNKLVSCGKYELNKKQGFWRYLKFGTETLKFVNYQNDTLVGLTQEFTSDSILISEGSFNKGLKDGYWKFYYIDGTIKEQGYFHNNYKSGWWQSYDNKGNLIEEASYSQDEISGYVKRYINGLITEEGKQFNGKKRGTWRFYNLEGKQNRIHEYEE